MDHSQSSEDEREADAKPILEGNSIRTSVDRENPEEGNIDEDAVKIFVDLEKILGDEPSERMKREVNLHPTLVTRWSDWLARGFSKQTLNELNAKYPRTGNCNLEAPILNPEVMHSLKETAQKRDKHFVNTQNLAGSALSALGIAITNLLKEEPIDKLKLLEILSDAAKLVIAVHHKESTARIAYILPGMGKQIKAVLEETKPDTLLFGHGLTEKLQDAIALEKLGKELKASQQQPPTTNKKPNPKPPGTSKWKQNQPYRPSESRSYNDQKGSRHPYKQKFQHRPRQNPYPLSPQNHSRSNSKPSERRP